MPINAASSKRNVLGLTRACDAPKLLAWPSAVGATALPILLDEATYTPLASLAPNDAPVLIGNGIYAYRPGPDEKMLKMEFCSRTGADGESQQWEIGAYGLAFPTATSYLWKQIGTSIVTLTLGTQTLATQTADPYTGAVTFTSSTLRWPDTYAESHNDFNNSTAGFYQLFPLGYGAANKSGHIVMDLSFVSLVAIRLIARGASSVQDFAGIYTEIN